MQIIGLLIKSSYMNQVNSLTSIPHEPIVVVHQVTMVANHLHKNGKWGTVTPANKNLLFLKSGKIGSFHFSFHFLFLQFLADT